MNASGAVGIFRDAISDFFEDDAMTLGAALAYYTALSLAPLLVLLMWIASFLGESRQQEIIEQAQALIGPQAGEAIDMVVQNAEEANARTLAGILGLITLLLGATGVFGQLQHALNLIWDVKAKPGQGAGGWIRKRVLSLGMILALVFILIVSLVVSAALSAVIGSMEGALPGSGLLWRAIDIVVSLAVFTLLFAIVFKYLPDVKIGWRAVWFGAFATAVLFVIGKMLIGLYLGYSSAGSAYGAAGSLIVLLIWVYYSGLIVFFGAEVTQVWARRYGRGIEPDEHAVAVVHTCTEHQPKPMRVRVQTA